MYAVLQTAVRDRTGEKLHVTFEHAGRTLEVVVTAAVLLSLSRFREAVLKQANVVYQSRAEMLCRTTAQVKAEWHQEVSYALEDGERQTPEQSEVRG